MDHRIKKPGSVATPRRAVKNTNVHKRANVIERVANLKFAKRFDGALRWPVEKGAD